MKQIISLIFATMLAMNISAQTFPTKVQPSTAEDYVLLLQRNGYQSYAADISALKDENYLIEPVIRHYKGGRLVENPFDFSIAFTTHEGDKSVNEKVRVGFTPGENPAIRMMSFFVSERGAMQVPLVFDERKHPQTDEVQDSYGYRPFVIEQLELGEFIPIALCGAYWYDPDGDFYRFCGENEISPAMTEDILKDLEEYYIIGMIVNKQQ